MVTSLKGTQFRLHYHYPRPRELAIAYDSSNEGNTSLYVRVFKDGDLLRMYFPRLHYDFDTSNSTS